METANRYCKSCSQYGSGQFCSACGQSYSVKRITLSSVMHDVFHFFTHLEKGFGYTLMRLLKAPGLMQREYVEGVRSRYQKPFSMFFICASANAIARYWIEELLIRYFHGGTAAEASLRHEYQLILLLIAMPVIAAFTWLAFARSKYNYAETAVLQLYSVSFVLIATILIACLRFIWHDLDTVYIEFPIFIVYWIITSIRFYNDANPWVVAVKSVVLTVAFFALIQSLEDFTMSLIRSRG